MREEKKEDLQVVEDNYGKVCKVKNKIKRKMLIKHDVSFYWHHNVDLVGNPTRRLMGEGVQFFLEISDYVTSTSDDNKLDNADDNSFNDWINTAHKEHGSAWNLLDKTFSVLNS